MDKFNLREYITEGKILIHENQSIRSHVKMGRKPIELTDIPSTDWEFINPDIQDKILNLDVHSNIDLFDDFPFPIEREFLTNLKGETYFVDPQGFNYARYVGRIDDFPNISEDLNEGLESQIFDLIDKLEQSYEWDYVEQEGSYATRFDFDGDNSLWINHTDGSAEGNFPNDKIKSLVQSGTLAEEEEDDDEEYDSSWCNLCDEPRGVSDENPYGTCQCS